MDWLIHHAKRVARITAGIVVVVVGVVLAVPGVPGPGLLVVFIGLSILAVDFVWAYRLKKKIESTAKDAVDKVRGKKES
jgi:tellurite resistance protein TerC